MPLYFFDLYDGQDLPDREGADLADMAAVQARAIEVLLSQWREDVDHALAPQSWALEVRNETRRTLFRLRFDSFRRED